MVRTDLVLELLSSLVAIPFVFDEFGFRQCHYVSVIKYEAVTMGPAWVLFCARRIKTAVLVLK